MFIANQAIICLCQPVKHGFFPRSFFDVERGLTLAKISGSLKLF